MRDFFKYVFATVVGLIVAALALMFMGIISLFGLSASADNMVSISKQSIAEIDLNAVISERSQDTPFNFLSSRLVGTDDGTLGLNDVLKAIEEAKNNENIVGIYLVGDALEADPASLEAIRHALTDFKKSGKTIVAYGDNYGQGFYYVASVADRLMVNPKGTVSWHGLSGSVMFYKELMDKLGIDMQIFKVGTFKSAVEPYMLTSMSDANREQVTQYLSSIWGNILRDVAESRNIDTARLNDIADENAMFLRAEILQHLNLVDTLIYETNVKEYIQHLMHLDKGYSSYGISELSNVQSTKPKDKAGNVIAVYYAAGEIDSSTAGMGGTDEGIISTAMVSSLRKLQEDDDVKAVVLRVNSPGGSAYGSEQIWHAVNELKTKKPVIVSMGGYAASGGYYISCNADQIVAEATTLTGSIGIFGMMPNLKGLADKIGVNVETVNTNQNGDMGNTMRPMTEAEKRKMQRYVEDGYDLFLTRCAEGRGMTKIQIDSIGQGRVWTGEMAKELGLVDVIGGLDTAIELAAEAAEVESYTLQEYPSLPSLLDMLMDFASVKLKAQFAPTGYAGRFYKELQFMNSLEQKDPLQALMPYTIEIK